MRTLSGTSRTEDGPSDETLNYLQQYLWHQAHRGWDPMRPNTAHWSYDDNIQSMELLGFIIAQSPNLKCGLEVVGVGRHARTPQKDIIATIARMSSIDPLCAKALAALTKHKLLGESKL